jgi:tetratricopeptide (TPR) repeat protein
MAGPESELQRRYQPAPTEEVQRPALTAVPLALRKSAVEKFDREFRADQKARIESLGVADEVAQQLLNARTLLAKGECQLAHGIFRAVLKFDPANEMAVRGLAECAKAQFHHEEAVRVLRKLVETHKSSENFKLLGDQLYAMEYNADALEAYLRAQQARDLSPENEFEVYKNVGNILLRLGDADGAEEYYNKAYTLFPESDILRVNFGSLALYRGEYDKALERFRESVHLNDRNDKGWVGLAMIHREYGDAELSWANLEKALDVNPGNESALRLVAEWAMKDNDMERGINRLEAYLARRPDDAQMSMWLAKFLYFSGRLEAALIEIEKALHLDPSLEGGADVLAIVKSEIRNKMVSLK